MYSALLQVRDPEHYDRDREPNSCLENSSGYRCGISRCNFCILFLDAILIAAAQTFPFRPVIQSSILSTIAA